MRWEATDLMQTCGVAGETVSAHLVTACVAIFRSLHRVFLSFFFSPQEATTTPPLADDMSPEEVLHLFFFVCQSKMLRVISLHIIHVWLFFFFLTLLPLIDRLTQIKAWEEEELDKAIDMEQIRVDPSPFQLVERTSLHKVTTE